MVCRPYIFIALKFSRSINFPKTLPNQKIINFITVQGFDYSPTIRKDLYAVVFEGLVPMPNRQIMMADNSVKEPRFYSQMKL